MSSTNKKYIYLFILVIIITSGLAVSPFLQRFLNNSIQLLDLYGEKKPTIGPLIFILLSAASVMLGPFTSAPFVPFAFAIWGGSITIFLLMVGWMIGNSVAYGLGYFLGYPLAVKIVSQKKLDEWVNFLSKKIDIRILFLFRLATPSEVGYVFGIFKYNFWKYLAITLPAEVPYAFILTFASGGIVNGQLWITAILAALGFGLLLGALYIFHRVLKSKKIE